MLPVRALSSFPIPFLFTYGCVLGVVLVANAPGYFVVGTSIATSDQGFRFFLIRLCFESINAVRNIAPSVDARTGRLLVLGVRDRRLWLGTHVDMFAIAVRSYALRAASQTPTDGSVYSLAAFGADGKALSVVSVV